MSRAEVSFRNKEARVTYDPDEVTVEQMIDAVTRLGFGATRKEPERSVPAPKGR